MKKRYILLFLYCFLSIQSTHSIQQDPLIQALNDGDLLLAKKLIKNGADSTIIQEAGSTALTRAVSIKDKDLVAFLLDHGADLFAPNDQGYIPWIMALEDNDENFLDFLRTYQPHKKDALLLGAAVHSYASHFEKQ